MKKGLTTIIVIVAMLFVSLESMGQTIGYKNNKRGMTDPAGNIMIPFVYDEINHLDGEFYCVRKEKLWGLYYLTEKLLECEYLAIEHFSDSNLCLISKGRPAYAHPFFDHRGADYFGLYDLASMSWALPCSMSYIDEVDYEGLRRFCDDGKWGFVNETGQIVIPAIYDHADYFKDGVAMVQENGMASLLHHPSDMVSNVPYNYSDVDINIGKTTTKRHLDFAFIVANESYTDCNSCYSLNDGVIFKRYCSDVLGIPENNIKLYEDATLGTMISAISMMKDIIDVYDEKINIIFYYSGLGICESSEKYLCPVDFSCSNIASSCLSLNNMLSSVLSDINQSQLTLLIDAPFNGKDKSGKQIVKNSRGVSISKNRYTYDNLVVFEATDGKENCYYDDICQHGIFTYYVLKYLQNNTGKINYSDMINFVSQEVPKHSYNKQGEVQKTYSNLFEIK